MSDAATRRLWLIGPGEAGRTIALDDGVVTVGRDSSCDVVLDDESVSSAHLRIEVRGPSVIVTDLDSRNGTAVNGEALRSPRRLRGGDVIEAGRHRLELNLPRRDPSARTAAASHRRIVLTPEERLTARALVAPYRDGSVKAGRPATREEMAASLQVSQRTARRRLDALATRLGVQGGRDRPRLVAEEVLAGGLDA